jgi:hypothetical protein
MNRDYDTTWKLIVQMANADFALGVNQVRASLKGNGWV